MFFAPPFCASGQTLALSGLTGAGWGCSPERVPRLCSKGLFGGTGGSYPQIHLSPAMRKNFHVYHSCHRRTIIIIIGHQPSTSTHLAATPETRSSFKSATAWNLTSPIYITNFDICRTTWRVLAKLWVIGATTLSTLDYFERGFPEPGSIGWLATTVEGWLLAKSFEDSSQTNLSRWGPVWIQLCATRIARSFMRWTSCKNLGGSHFKRVMLGGAGCSDRMMENAESLWGPHITGKHFFW